MTTISFTTNTPGFTITDDAADSLIGQTAPLIVGGLTVGDAKVTDTHVTSDGLWMTVEAANTPMMLGVLAPHLQPRRLDVSLAVTTHATQDDDGKLWQSVALSQIAYPADEADE